MAWKSMLPGRVSGFVIALGLFVGAAVALNLNLSRLRDSFAWVEHTNEVLRNVSASERALVEAELGERGYLPTGDASYLDSYNRSQRVPEYRIYCDNWFQAIPIRRNDLTAEHQCRAGRISAGHRGPDRGG
jgi:CHASE3 domain